MLAQEVQEPFVVLGPHVEQPRDDFVVAPRVLQSPTDDLPHISPSDLALHVQWIDGGPERLALLNQPLVQIIGHGGPPLAARARRDALRLSEVRRQIFKPDHFPPAVECVEVTDLKDNTYFALIYLQVNGRQVTIDARPSDAISLALRTKSPIYVAKKVLEASSVLQQMEEGKDQDLSNISRDKWAEILEKMSPDDFKYKM